MNGIQKLLVIDFTALVIIIGRLVTNPTLQIRDLQFIFNNIPRIIYSLLSIHHVHRPVCVPGSLTECPRQRIGNRRGSHFSFLCRDHNHTVRCPRTVYRRGRSILQHVDLVNIVRVYTGNRIPQQIHKIQIIDARRVNIHRIRQNHTIQHPQRSLRPQNRRRSPDLNLWSRTHLSRILHENHPRHTPLQHLIHRTYPRHHNIIHLQRSHRTRHVPFIHVIIPVGNDLIQRGHIFLHDHVNWQTDFYFPLDLFHTYECKYKHNFLIFRNR